MGWSASAGTSSRTGPQGQKRLESSNVCRRNGMVRRSRVAGWLMVAALAALGLQRLGWHRSSHAIGTALHALTRATLLVVGAGWPLLLLAAAAALGLALTGSSGRTRRSAIGAAVRRL